MTYDQGNIFAKILRGEIAAQKFFEDEWTIAILDVMPQSDGHALVIPKCAAENIFELDPAFASAVMHTGQLVARTVRDVFAADGVTLMQFNGPEAGQTVFHFHLHVIPRYAGKPLRKHGRSLANPARLTEQATRLRAALANKA
jgi:histidine triad (HIT) family protein